MLVNVNHKGIGSMHTEAQCHASDISNQFDNRADAIAHVNEYAEARDLSSAMAKAIKESLKRDFDW